MLPDFARRRLDEWRALPADVRRSRIRGAIVASRTAIMLLAAAVLFPVCPPLAAFLFAVAMRFLGS